jgi:hypothetical protein
MLSQSRNSKPRGPDFLVIGAQRAGTAWLYFVLKRHPRLWLPPIKEIHYFDNLNEGTADDPKRWLRAVRGRSRSLNLWMFNYLLGKRNEDWYAKLFHQAQLKGRIAGEITPSYATLNEQMFQRIRRLNRNVRLVFIMRDPVDRLWSAVTNYASKNEPVRGPLALEKALARARTAAFAARSAYTDTIARLEAVFPASQLHLCFYDDLRERPETLVAHILSFLGANPNEAKNILLSSKINSSAGMSPMPVEFQREMAKAYLPMVRVLCQRFAGPPLKWLARYERLVGCLAAFFSVDL